MAQLLDMDDSISSVFEDGMPCEWTVSDDERLLDALTFTCDRCGKTFTHKGTLNRHVKSVHEKVTYTCSKCSKTFTRESNQRQHQRVCRGEISRQTFPCSKCQKTYSRQANQRQHESSCQGVVTYPCDLCQEVLKTSRELQFHKKLKHKIKPARKRTRDPDSGEGPSAKRPRSEINPTAGPSTKPSQPTTYRCRRCPAQFPDRQALHAHQTERHYQVGAGLHAEPFRRGEEPWVNQDGSVDEALRECYRTNRTLILERYREGPVESLYNIPMFPDMTISDIGEALQGIYDRQQHAFKVNLSFGFIMRHVETGRYRYFRPFDNVNLFDAPILVSRRQDIVKILKKLKQMDVLAQMSKNRPNTKWRLVLLTNIRVKVYNTNFSLGGTDTLELPDYIRRSKAIVSLDKDPINKKPYHDHLCLFRCLCLHRHGSVDRSEVRELYDTWNRRYTDSEYQELLGNHQLQPLFKGVQLRELPDFEQCFEINVHMYSLNADGAILPVFKSKDRYADTLVVNQYDNHCSYVTDFAQYAKTFQCELCDRLFDHHGNFKKHLKICDQRTIYRFPGGFYRPAATVFQQLEDFGVLVPEDERTYPWFAVFDFESMLIRLEGDATDKLNWTHRHDPISVSLCSNVPGFREPRCIVNADMDALLKEMVAALYKMQEEAAAHAGDRWGSYLEQMKDVVKQMSDDTEDQAVDKEKAETMVGRFKAYMTTLPVLGFNSAKYDLNLVKRKLAKHLDMPAQEYGFVIKKANAYACLATDRLKFLDISHFLAPGTSYAGFLKAYGVEESKGFFPYEWLDDPAKLDYPDLPPREAFHSALKGTDIAEKDYAYCQSVWIDRGMTAFRDFLTWYNDLDVGPFVIAVERLQMFYFQKGIDVLKTAISVPGIARQLLFQSARERQAEFSLVDEHNSDLYGIIRANIVGGPSIIFTRHHAAGETLIRGEKPCRKIVGYDANALYLWAIGQPMPEGMFVRRRAENDFKPEHRDKYMQAFNWLNYLNEYQGAHIQHQRNRGQEVRFGRYPVDGYDSKTNTVYEFQGCYHHGHDCEVTQNVTDERWHQRKESLMQRTRQKVAYLRGGGYAVVEMWECQFRTFCKTNPNIYVIRDRCRPEFARAHKGAVTDRQILNGVRCGQLFGMVEVDIQVPDEWDAEFRTKMSLPPTRYFEEMCPLFCNTDVTFDDIGRHMQAHVWEHQLSDAPRRLLVGGLKARQILLATPLLKWYLDHGLKVTKIYQVVEYRKMACFESFVQDVSDARRAGDASPELAIIADTMKLIGNSGYGSLIMDKSKFTTVYYVEGENKACFQVNKPQFRQADCLDEVDQYYEVEVAKAGIKLDLPIQLGYFILQYAKLRMLQFYYDCLDCYVDRSNFEYLEMDTDSAYMALSASSLGDIVKPEKQAEYQLGLAGLCHDEFNPVGDRWFPRICCQTHARYDKRVPGLFKTEYEGDKMIGLCAKTYIVAKTSEATPPDCKFSSKGISKRLVADPLGTFERVLRTAQPADGQNKGFRVRNHGIYTYEQTRCGFSYFYCKRRVLDDGIHTVPLDIVLCPFSTRDRLQEEEKKAEEEDLIDVFSEEQLLDLLK